MKYVKPAGLFSGGIKGEQKDTQAGITANCIIC